MLKILTPILLFFSIHVVTAQENQGTSTDPFYINVFVDSDKNIYLEDQKISFDELENKVSEIIRNKPFKLDQNIIYRIFADENLKLGYIIDINDEMLSAYNEKVMNKRYLLNTVKLNIDGQNWLKKIKMEDLKEIK